MDDIASAPIPFDIERARLISRARRLDEEASMLLSRASGPDASRFMHARLTREAVALRNKAAEIRRQADAR